MTVSILSLRRGLVGGEAANQPPPYLKRHNSLSSLSAAGRQSEAMDLNIFTGQQ